MRRASWRGTLLAEPHDNPSCVHHQWVLDLWPIVGYIALIDGRTKMAATKTDDCPFLSAKALGLQQEHWEALVKLHLALGAGQFRHHNVPGSTFVEVWTPS